MRIQELQDAIGEVMYLNAAPGGGVESSSLSIQRASAHGLPEGLDAILVMSDLQGVSPDWRFGGEARLLGEEVADTYLALAAEGKVPTPEETGVILCGDLFSVPSADKRGATGDVRSVWQAFSALHRWVVGVSGNHDLFGSQKERSRLEELPNVYLLDGDAVTLDSITFGGVGYIVGNPGKTGRREEKEQLSLIRAVTTKEPDILILHEGPSGDGTQRGNTSIREIVADSSVALTCCGHVHWRDPVSDLSSTQQILNADARAILISR